jgi:undecaprenyl-diphosphatase
LVGSPNQKHMLDILIGFIIGLVQGVTEILPISSTAHLILASRFFGIAERGLEFDVLMNFASWLAIMVFFSRIILNIIRAWWQMFRYRSYQKLEKETREHVKLGFYLIISMIPAVILGFLFEGVIETYLRSNLVIAGALIGGGILLWIADISTRGTKTSGQLAWWQILIIGLFQSLALIPGMSRSGSTITGARFMGDSREEAASFAFLMGTPIIIAATVSQIPDIWGNPDIFSPDTLAGFVGAIIGTYATIALFLEFIKRQTYTVFVIYRLLAGTLLILISMYGI